MSVAVPELSVVLPAFNEEESLQQVWAEVSAVLDGLGRSAEVIFVDDGSADATPDIVRSFRAIDSRVRLIRLAANAGLSAALDAGFARARGRIVITLDSDLQNDPRDIPRMLGALEGYDAVTGWRQRHDDPWLKRISSRIANGVRNAVTRESVHDSACTLRVLRHGCLSCLPRFRGFHRFVPTLLRMRGFRVLEVPVSHRPRRFGRSKYGVMNRAFIALLDLLAVRWMKSRALAYEVAETVGGDVIAD